jgi:cbb3-type cytochrome c oxidase subunit II
MNMRMSPVVLFAGSILILFSVVLVVVVLPFYHTNQTTPSEIFRERTEKEAAGRDIYIANGCVYCHSQSIRVLDWGLGAHRIAQAGDYISDRPILLGSQRTGPDLSQQGGEHPNDWHLAHFVNPRYTGPSSIMPAFAFLGEEKLELLTAYVQSLGFELADDRMARQNKWKKRVIEAYEKGPVENVKWIHDHVPKPWRELPNPYPTSDAGLARGRKVYQEFCIGCHGPVGDGMGPAQPYLYPPPLNFTILKGRGISGGILYYQIMNGITGTAMPYFKKSLESEKIWEVGNYVAVYFINETDADTDPEGIDAAYEPLDKEEEDERVEIRGER